MKITLINHSDSLGGASTVTYRLMEALCRAGVEARMLVLDRRHDDSRVAVGASRRRARVPFLAEHLRIFAANGLSRKTLFKISIATDGLPLIRHPWVQDADAIVLNWVNQGMLSLDEIARIASSKPTLWTMHDMWNLTGVCHHAGSCDLYTSHCRHCPLLGRCAGDNDLAARTFDRKMRLYDSVPIHFVAVSNWLADKARNSALTASRPLSVINNPLDIEQFVHTPAKTRRALGLPTDGKLVVMCAARLDDQFKNLPDAIDALNRLGDTNARAVFVGECRNTALLEQLRIPYVHLGAVGDAERLRQIYAHAAVVLSSSTYESFGATLLEGQAAGAVPVGYVHDGRGDIITDGITGYAAGEGIRPLHEALRLALEQPIEPAALAAAARRYSYPVIAHRYLDLLAQS